MKKLAMLFSFLIPMAFAGGYLLATANARVTCTLQVGDESRGMPPVCADISSTGVTTGLLFGVVGFVAWAVGWILSARTNVSRHGSHG
jgi:hypothetical protein